ncbi:hypothetical protein ACS6LC_07950 [Enterobacter hormaechei subsp. xiangfangensis]|uniref:hypothetical protein n=1 Tax=Enterobacter hormaechei TaxID=158836 RepID=UPI0029282CAA|nr:hypothetical protein [Enterobacter hormaechei subsp. xiangfangensis]
MSNIDKQAQGEKTREAFERWAEQSGALPWGILKKHRNQDGTYPGPHYTYMWHAWNACHEALLDELEAKDRRIVELTDKPIGWTDEQELRDVEKLGCGYLFNANPITPHADPRRVILLYAALAGKGE